MQFANRSEAERCVSLAQDCRSRGDIERARRLLLKAQRLWAEVPGAAEMLSELNPRTSFRELFLRWEAILQRYLPPQLPPLQVLNILIVILILFAYRLVYGKEALRYVFVT